MFNHTLKRNFGTAILLFTIMMMLSTILISKPLSHDSPEIYRLPEKMNFLVFCRYISQKLDLTILFSNRIRMDRQVQIIVDDELSDVKLYNVFFTVLRLHSYTAIRRGEVVSIVRSRRARSMPIRVMGDSDVNRK